MTTTEYQAATAPKRLFYRVFRNPFVMFVVGPAILFVFGNRVFGAGATRRERFSVHFTNAGLVTGPLVAHWTIGLPTLTLIQLPTLFLAGAVGVWLFYVQHQFEDVYWARRGAWEPMRAALEGSSYYKLPKVLQWFTGSIGLHHIHHVQPRIPSYNLQSCHARPGVPGGAAADAAPQPGLAAPAPGGRASPTHGQLGGSQRGWRQTFARTRLVGNASREVIAGRVPF